MITPAKYRDRIFAAVLRYVEADPRTRREKQDAYEDLMVTVDEVIEEIAAKRERNGKTGTT